MNNKTEPKYLKVIEAIKKQIADNVLCVGDRLQSENELSHFFGLSRQTVRQATSILESEGILERRRGSGTYVTSARIVPHAVTMNIGVITTYLDDYIFPSVIQGIDRILTQNGYSMQLSITYNKVENETKILEALLEKGVDGLIIEPTKSGLPNLNMDLYRHIKRQGIPCVFIHACYQEMSFPYVAMDDFMCGKAAADYLVKKNHTQIAAVLKSDDMQGHLRYAGYASELKKSKLLLREDRIVWFTTEDLDIKFAENFEQQVFKRLENCTAVVCYNDQIALSVMKILVKNNKRIPLDVSVISFDNSNLATMGPVGLTTFSHPKEELGKIAAENLMKLIKNEPCDIAVKFKPELIERNSVCKL